MLVAPVDKGTYHGFFYGVVLNKEDIIILLKKEFAPLKEKYKIPYSMEEMFDHADQEVINYLRSLYFEDIIFRGSPFRIEFFLSKDDYPTAPPAVNFPFDILGLTVAHVENSKWKRNKEHPEIDNFNFSCDDDYHHFSLTLKEYLQERGLPSNFQLYHLRETFNLKHLIFVNEIYTAYILTICITYVSSHNVHF